MAKRRTTKKKPGGMDLGGTLRPEIWGILLLLMALLTLLSLIPVERGRLMENWIELLETAVGWGVWLMPIGFGAVGLWLIFLGLGRQMNLEREKPWGGALLFFLALALMHMIAGGEDPLATAANGEGGGYVGYGLSQLLVSGLGTPGAWLVLVALSIISLMMLLGLSLGEMWAILADAVARLFRRQPSLPGIRINRPDRPAGLPSPPPAMPEQQPEGIDARPLEPAGHLAPRQPGSVFPRIIGGEQVWRLPNVDDILADAVEQELSQAEIRERVRIIEDTLNSFGVPAKVKEVNQGPTVTQ
ncbi:MAG: hypothetical protein GX597_18170, partial [Anaerolineaceae bacterium]|nr:hypothetical protein [Anaerolineaceae bacterium]